MRIVSELGKLADALLPIDHGSEVDDYQIFSNMWYGLGGFVGQQTVRFIEHGNPLFSVETAKLSVAGLACSGLGVYFRQKANQSEL